MGASQNKMPLSGTSDHLAASNQLSLYPMSDLPLTTIHALESLCRCHRFLLDVSSVWTNGIDGSYIHLHFCSGNKRTVLRGDRPAVLQETVCVLLYQHECWLWALPTSSLRGLRHWAAQGGCRGWSVLWRTSQVCAGLWDRVRELQRSSSEGHCPEPWKALGRKRANSQGLVRGGERTRV